MVFAYKDFYHLKVNGMKDNQSLADMVKEIVESRRKEQLIPDGAEHFIRLSRERDALFGKPGDSEMATPQQIHQQNQKMLAQAYDLMRHA